MIFSIYYIDFHLDYLVIENICALRNNRKTRAISIYWYINDVSKSDIRICSKLKDRILHSLLKEK